MRHLILRSRLTRWGTALATFFAIVTTVSRAQTQQVLLQETFGAPSTSSSVLTLDVNAPGLPCLTADPGAGGGNSTIQNCNLTPPDPAGAGTLRLTSAAEQHASGFVAETSLPTAQGLEISFTQYQYGGYGLDGPGSPGGADGISFFMAVAPPSPDALGPQGGALGYASAGTVPGLPGAWLGIGLDAFGNFSNPAFGSPSCPVQQWAGFNADAITVRGPGHGTTGYCLLATSATTTPGGLTLRDTDRAASAREITIRITPTDGLFRVYVDDGSGAVLATSGALPASYYNPTTGALTAGLPPRVTFGFAASTGSATDIHEISDLTATTTSGVVPVLSLTKTTSLSGAPSPGQAFNYLLTPRVDGTTPETRPLTIRVSDEVPAGLVLSGTPSGTSWLCSTTSTTAFTCAYTNPASIPGGTALPSVTVPVIVDMGVPSGTTLVNTASALSDDAAAPATGSVSVTVNAVQPLAITTASLPNGTVGTPYSSSLAATGGTGSRTWSLASGTLPNGLSLSAAGLISGTPTATGTSSFTVRVTDGAGATRTRALSLTVVSLSITTASLPSARVGQAYAAQLQAAGGSGALRWSLDSGTMPPGLTLSVSGQIAGTPTAEGVSTIFVRVTDAGGATAARGFNLQVLPAKLTVTTIQLAPGEVGLVYAAQLAATGGTLPYSWSLYSGALPPGLALTAQGAIAGRPTAPGTSVFWVRVTDSKGRTDGQRLSITILPALTITTTSVAAGRVGAVYSASLARTGGFAPFTWTLAAGTLPPGLALSTAGVLSGTPTAVGTFAFTVRVRDALNAVAVRQLSIGVVLRNEKAYIAESQSGSFGISVVNVATGALVKRIPVPRADGTVAAPNGKRVYYWGTIGIPNSVGLIDTTSDTVVRTASVTLGSNAYTWIEDVKVSPDNSRLYVVAQISLGGGGYTGTILVLNAATLATIRQFTLPQTAEEVALSPDGATAYVSTIQPGGVYKLHSMSTSTGTIIASLTVPFYAYSMLVIPSGDLVVSSAYPGGQGSGYHYGILEYTGPNLTETSRTDTPAPLYWIDAAGGSAVFGVSRSPGSVTSVQLATGAVDSAPMAPLPNGLAIDAAGQYGYTVTSAIGSSASLVRFNLASLALTTPAALPSSMRPETAGLAIAAVGP